MLQDYQISLKNCKDCGACLDKAVLKGNRCMVCHGKETTRRKKEKRQHLIDMHGDKCADCGKTYPAAVYDFHHVGDTKDAVAKMINHNLKLETLVEEAHKCVLLCANCHRLRHFC